METTSLHPRPGHNGNRSEAGNLLPPKKSTAPGCSWQKHRGTVPTWRDWDAGTPSPSLSAMFNHPWSRDRTNHIILISYVYRYRMIWSGIIRSYVSISVSVSYMIIILSQLSAQCGLQTPCATVIIQDQQIKTKKWEHAHGNDMVYHGSVYVALSYHSLCATQQRPGCRGGQRLCVPHPITNPARAAIQDLNTWCFDTASYDCWSPCILAENRCCVDLVNPSPNFVPF